MPTSVPVQPTITAVGLAAVFNAQSTGVHFEISHIAFGTAQYIPDGTEDALQAEKIRVPIAGGGRISPTQIQIYAIAMAASGDPFFVGEVGFFGDDGATLLAVYSSLATPNLFLSDTVATSISYALGLAALPANSVTVTIDPSASAALLIIGQHVAAADPHPQYVEKVNGVAFYDPDLAFNLGAQIIGDDLLVYQSAQADNIGHPPSSSPTWWEPLYNYGDTPVTGLTNVSVTLTSTQAARAHITLSGAPTAPISIIFPNWVKDWTVVNTATGSVAITCKTAAGTGVVIPQNGSPTRIHGDGTNITQLPENIAPAVAANQAVQLGQVAASSVAQCYLTLSGANLVLNRYRGTQVYSPGGGVVTIPGAGITLAPAGLTSTTLYYVYLDPNGGAPRLVVSTTGHSTDATGVEVQTGNNSLVLVGMGWALTATSWEGTVRSWANDPGYGAKAGITSASATTSTTLTNINTGLVLPFLLWPGESPICGFSTNCQVANANVGINCAISIDSAAPTDPIAGQTPANTSNVYIGNASPYAGLSEGHHTMNMFGSVSGATTGTWSGAAAGLPRTSTSIYIAPRK